jgi:flavin reductase (DIM6/NTAB) family NADH-FMN oxidoreductase RutF
MPRTGRLVLDSGPEGDMTGDVTGFGELVARLDPAMAVVTTSSGQERAGCLVGFHAQCSIVPSRYVVWLSKANHTLRVGMHARHFALHFLGQDDVELARLFGTTSGDRVDKFARSDWSPGAGGVPLLHACPNRFAADKVALLDEGSDHVCLVLQPTEVATGRGWQPLRLAQVTHLQPGHEAEERPTPRTERAPVDG